MTDTIDRLNQSLADRYRIEQQLGQGGMATVYLAHDLRHDRKVAVKVLRPELGAVIGAERFLAEIRTTAHLQHPHILPLHDSGEVDGLVYYVMPNVEGESLRDRLQREKQLPIEEAVRITREIAEALDYAHRHGVVHRDIKPENVLLHDGRALVADFGIALAVSRSDGGTRMTETGMSLGTPHYMSPEQAMGEREITARSDVYALGCVLYEMLAGEPPFTGPTAQAVIARVVTEEPRSLTLQRRSVPPHVEAVVRKALEKLPADRFQSAGQFAQALEQPGLIPLTSITTGAAGAPPVARSRAPLLGSLALALLASAVAIWAVTRPGPPSPVRRYGMVLPEGQEPLMGREFAISPDGSRLLYLGPGQQGQGQLWLKPGDRYDAIPLQGTVGAATYTFSPDGEWVAFHQGGQVKKISINGGAAVTLSDSAAFTLGRGLAWLDDGTIVFVRSGGVELRRVSETGAGEAVPVWTDSVPLFRVSPLPGSRGVLFIRCAAGCTLGQELWVLDLRSGQGRKLLEGVAGAWYASTGHIVFVRRDGGLLAMPFNPRSLVAEGAPVPILDSVGVADVVVPLLALSAEGTLILQRATDASALALYGLVWVDRQGVETPIDSAWTFRMIQNGANAGWALSPDGRRLAIGLHTDAGDDIWVKQLPDGPLSRVSYDSAAEYRPRWLPDGRSLLFISTRPPSISLYRRSWDATGSDQHVLGIPGAGIFEAQMTRDGRWLLFRTGGTVYQRGRRDIMALRVGTDTTPIPLVASPAFDEAAIALSPDGRWLAYESDETGQTEVFLRPFPEVESVKAQLSTSGGRAPLWSADGRELFYVDAARMMMVAAVGRAGPDGRPEVGERHALFRLREALYLADQENYTPYDISPDGRRFIMARRAAPSDGRTARLIVVENWFEELKARLRR